MLHFNFMYVSSLKFETVAPFSFLPYVSMSHNSKGKVKFMVPKTKRKSHECHFLVYFYFDTC